MLIVGIFYFVSKFHKKLGENHILTLKITFQAVVNKSPMMANPELDVLKHELQKSMSTIDELKELVVKLSSENTELKARITSSDGGSQHDEYVFVIFSYFSHFLTFFVFLAPKTFKTHLQTVLSKINSSDVR